MQLNSATSRYLNGLSALRHLYEGLYKLDENGTPVLGQASAVEVTDDMMNYTFTLRDDITWSDGQPVTSADFVYAWDNLFAQGEGYAKLLDDVCASYEAPVEKTIVMHMSLPCSFLPSILSFPSTAPIRQDYVEQYGEDYGTDPDKSVYNGPYQLTDWQHGSEAVLTLRDDYYDAQSIRVGTIHWMFIGEEEAALASFESGDVIYSDLCPASEHARMEGKGIFYVPGNNNYCVMFNLGPNGDPVLKDGRVRRALSLAIDRNFVMALRGTNVEIGKTLACSGYVNDAGEDFTDYADPWFEPNDFEGNCEEARSLLAAAGFEGGEGFPQLTYIVNNDNRREIAEAIVNDWKSILGIDSITVEKIENFSTARKDGDYDLAYYGWYMDYTDLSNMFGCFVNTATSNSFYFNEIYDAEYGAAISFADQATQWEHYAECEKILSQDLPVAVILHSMNSYLFDDKEYEGLVYSCGNFVFTYLRAK